MRLITAGGVPAGASRAVQTVISKPAMDSRTAGTAGSTGLRPAEVVARALALPAWMLGKAEVSAKRKSTCPPSKAASAGAVPEKGMCVALAAVS